MKRRLHGLRRLFHSLPAEMWSIPKNVATLFHFSPRWGVVDAYGLLMSMWSRIWLRTHINDFTAGSVAANIYKQYIFWIHISYLLPSHICSHTMRSLGCQHTDVVFNIKHTVADGISNGNANGPFRNDSTSPVYLLCICLLEVSTNVPFQLWNMKK